MMKEVDDIEELFSSAFDGAGALPPDSVKQQIDKALVESGAVPNNQRRIGWFSTFILFFIVGVLFFEGDVPSESLGLVTGEVENLVLDSEQNRPVEVMANSNQLAVIDSSISPVYHRVDFNDGGKPSYAPVELKSAPLTSQLAVMNHLPLDQKSENSRVLNDVALDRNDSSTEYQKPSAEAQFTTGARNANTLSSDGLLSEQQENEWLASNAETEEGMLLTEFSSFAAQSDIVLATKSVRQFSLLTNETNVSEHPPISVVNKHPNKLSLMLYGGAGQGFNTLNQTANASVNMDEAVSEAVGLEAGLSLLYPIGQKWHVSLGLDYAMHENSFTQSVQTGADSTFTGMEITPIYVDPVAQDSVIDSLFTPTYDVTPLYTEHTAIYRLQSMGIPLYAYRTMRFGGNWSVNIGVGARFSFANYVLQSEEGIPELTFKSFGITAQLRPELVHYFNRFGVGAYGTMQYELISDTRWDTYKRTRWGIGGGLFVSVKL